MMRITGKLLAIILCVGLVGGCFLDPEPPPPDKPPPPAVEFKDLSEPDNVLFNLEQAYLQRNGTQYERLIDDDFIFYFDDGDVGGPGGGGNPIPEQWDQQADVSATQNMFSQPPTGVLNIDLELALDNVQWIAQPQATETWYTTTVPYNFEFQVTTELTYISSGTQSAQFSVRNAGTDTAPVWKLVAWRDIAP